MDADAKTFVTLVAPLAVLYMTYSSVQGTPQGPRPPAAKAVSVGQLGTAPKLPSSETKLRDPFLPAGGAAAHHGPAERGKKADLANQPLRLDGTAIVGNIRFAIINGVRVTQGDFFRGMRLVRVETNSVLLAGDSQEISLPLEIVKSDAIEVPPATVAKDTDRRTAVARATGAGSGKPALTKSGGIEKAKPPRSGITAKPLEPKGGAKGR